MEQAKRRFAVVFDVGGTKVEGSLVDNTGAIHNTIRKPAPSIREEMLTLICDLYAELAHNREPAGIGFSIPGSIDPQTGLLRNAPNSPCIDGTPLAADLSARLPLKPIFENDANCLALSEFAFGAARGYRHVAGVILGTGVGLGIIINGQIFNGSRGLAPEGGHLPLNINGRLCGCGNQGCAEAYLSGPAVLARYHQAGGDPTVTLTKDIFERTTDPAAMFIRRQTALMFARYMATLVSLYDPEVFVLGGGLSLQDLFYQQEDLIARYTFGSREVPPILKAQIGDSSGKLGAAALVFQQTHKD